MQDNDFLFLECLDKLPQYDPKAEIGGVMVEAFGRFVQEISCNKVGVLNSRKFLKICNGTPIFVPEKEIIFIVCSCAYVTKITYEALKLAYRESKREVEDVLKEIDYSKYEKIAIKMNLPVLAKEHYFNLIAEILKE